MAILYIDLDIIITEEIFHIIEHFCLGRRRLHLFGTDNSIRPGWLTIGPSLISLGKFINCILIRLMVIYYNILKRLKL